MDHSIMYRVFFKQGSLKLDHRKGYSLMSPITDSPDFSKAILSSHNQMFLRLLYYIKNRDTFCQCINCSTIFVYYLEIIFALMMLRNDLYLDQLSVTHPQIQLI